MQALHRGAGTSVDLHVRMTAYTCNMNVVVYITKPPLQTGKCGLTWHDMVICNKYVLEGNQGDSSGEFS